MTEDLPLAPRCGKCGRRHLPELRCWTGRYAATLVTATLHTAGTTCWLCGHPAADSADHVTPRSHGGTDHPDNLRPAHHDRCPTCHRTCNADRGNNPNPFTPDPEPQPSGVGLSPRWRPGT